MNLDEQRSYARGYAAGKRRRQSNMAAERHQRERQALLDRAFLVALPVILDSNTWTVGGKAVTSAADRVKVAWDIAEQAIKQRRYA